MFCIRRMTDGNDGDGGCQQTYYYEEQKGKSWTCSGRLGGGGSRVPRFRVRITQQDPNFLASVRYSC